MTVHGNSLLSGLLKKGPQMRGSRRAEKGAEEDRRPMRPDVRDGRAPLAENEGTRRAARAAFRQKALERWRKEGWRRRTRRHAERMPPEEAEERVGKHGSSSSGRTACGRKRRKVVQLRRLNMEQVILGLSDDMKTSLRRECCWPRLARKGVSVKSMTEAEAWE